VRPSCALQWPILFEQHPLTVIAFRCFEIACFGIIFGEAAALYTLGQQPLMELWWHKMWPFIGTGIGLPRF
jgi:hypothetical protein